VDILFSFPTGFLPLLSPETLFRGARLRGAVHSFPPPNSPSFPPLSPLIYVKGYSLVSARDSEFGAEGVHTSFLSPRGAKDSPHRFLFFFFLSPPFPRAT